MKKFSDLDLVQNLTWRQVITYSTLTLTTLVAATWTIATRVADSKAEYVNMRYAEIKTLQTQLSELQAENEKYRKLDPKNKDIAHITPTENEIKELQVSESYFDPKSALFISIEKIDDSSAILALNLPNGKRESGNWVKVGYSLTFENKEKKYQFILVGIKDKKVKVTVREL